MSGKLIHGHARFEGNCDKCHQPFNEAPQAQLCLDCHKEISDDLSKARGFHGRVSSIKTAKCKHCHTDHKGRSADIVRLDNEMFDHTMTDFALKGGHIGVDCQKCHKAGVKHRDTSSVCSDCHTKNDPHQGNLGRKCADCHNETLWSKTKFDHNKTGFPLKGKHGKPVCSFCHPDKRFNEKTSATCYSCHVVSDVHNGEYGKRCAKCHNPINWKGALFNHDRLKFPLTGQHKKVACETCHRGKSYPEGPGTSCFFCHSEDDKHGGKFGQTCERCHKVENEWYEYLFDHGKTGFPLLDRHEKVPCDSCHRTALKPGADTSCFGCHRRNDVHVGKYGKKCKTCHTLQNRWSDHIFDHAVTKFRLLGSHQKTKCHLCHKKKLNEQEPRLRCFDCHSEDDIHKKQEGVRCEECHNEWAWNQKVFFDHDLTRFPLTGMHAVTPCEECHMDFAYKDTPTNCYSCHKSDDAHEQRLGANCPKCHNPNSWRLWTFDHKNQTRFALDGRHEKLRCRLCHKSVLKDSLKVPERCVDCHRGDDNHRERFGVVCKKCHTTNSFKELNILH